MPDALDLEGASTSDLDADEWLDLFHRTTAEFRAERRDHLMVTGLMSGLTLQQVGDLYGLTRERVRQIATAQGYPTRELRAAKKAQSERRQRRVARHIYGASLTYPELTLDELAEWADTDVATVRSALGGRVAVHEIATNDWSDRTSDESLLAGLRQWVGETASYTGDSYTAWAERHGLPGRQTVAIRFGSWNGALAAAGLERLVRYRGGPRPEISDKEMWASVMEFFRTDLKNYSFTSYSEFASERGLPSGAALRNRLGSWSTVKEKTRELLRYAADCDGTWQWGESVLEVVPGEAARAHVTSEQVLDAIKAVATRTTGPLTVAIYDDSREAHQPNGAMAQRRFGSWVAALEAAGLTDRFSGKARGKWGRGDYETR